MLCARVNWVWFPFCFVYPLSTHPAVFLQLLLMTLMRILVILERSFKKIVTLDNFMHALFHLLIFFTSSNSEALLFMQLRWLRLPNLIAE